MSELQTHLLHYGIYHFKDDSYWSWGGEILGRRNGKQIDRLRKPLQRGNPKKRDLFAFYEFISVPDIAAVVHSMKADAIRATGEFVASNIHGSSVLDVGCNIGYLTTWFALTKPNTQVLGIDFSIGSIKTAKEFASQLRIKNVNFLAFDANQFEPTERYDCIVDTQGLVTENSSPKDIERLLSWLTPDGQIICVPAIGDLNAFLTFLDMMETANAAVKACSSVKFNDMGEHGAYPTLIIKRVHDFAGLSKQTMLDIFQGILDDYHALAV